MNEEQARNELNLILDHIHDTDINYQETYLEGDKSKGFVWHHMNQILQTSGGKWNTAIAAQHITSFQIDYDLDRTPYTVEETDS